MTDTVLRPCRGCGTPSLHGICVVCGEAEDARDRPNDRRYVTVFAVGNDGNVERRWTIKGTNEHKLDWLRAWTAEAYAETFGERPRAVNVNDWPVLGGERHVHGVEGATFAFPADPPHGGGSA